MAASTPGHFIEVIYPGSVDSPKIQSNAVAPMMNIEWEPVTNKCAMNFVCQKFLVVDGQWVKAMGVDDKMPFFTLKLSDDFTKRWAYDGAVDPVTGAALDQISVAGVMEIIKHAFEQGYDQEFARRAALTPPIPPPVIPPEAPASMDPPPEEEA